MSIRIIASNKKAHFQYTIESTFEAGIVLKGSEVKSLRMIKGGASIDDSYAGHSEGEFYLFNSHIAQYGKASYFNHEMRRNRKLLMHKSEINKLVGKIKQKGYTLIPMKIYFNDNNLIKVEMGLGKGKKLYDKRQDIIERDANRESRAAMKERVRFGL